MRMFKKVYVKILAEFLSEGGIRPRKLFWCDNAVFIIDRVKYVENAPPKSGGLLTKRYTCAFGENERYLYYDKANERWFIEQYVKSDNTP